MDSSSAVVSYSQYKSINLVISEQLKDQSTGNTSSKTTSISLSTSSTDRVEVGMDAIYKSLTVLADKVIAKLNELLKDKLPDGIASLKPEDHTSEATAARIADGSTALMAIYAKQHPELEGEELISSFMETIRGGIKQGYDEASSILGDIGAFNFDGVKSAIEKTMSLVEEKLIAFETEWRKQNGLTPDTQVPSSDTSQTAQTPAVAQASALSEVVVA